MRGVSKTYRGVVALDRIDLEIGPGITGLLGPNGAGKSTLIKILLGLVRPTTGSASVLGLDLRRQGRAVRQIVGYVPEDDCYIPGLTGVEVVRFAASLSGIPATEGLRRSHEILDYCGMKQERYRTIETYSTGMRQKIKFAAALVHDPQILILDEPTSGLDPEEREALLARIRHLAATAKKSVLISTHILPDVQTTCEYVVILAKGQVRLNQSLEEVNRPASGMLTI
ncbi:MAG TPA: ABC transporter ATP-binding protein, partial [Pirellulaceae bacterium]|nr:ABC transporter ATP-binding protein [Pirellulaceae bacterium]